MEGQRFSKIVQTTRILALGAALTLCALATGSLGFKVYTNLSEVRQIDANLSDRHLHKLSLDYERLQLMYSQTSNGQLLDQVKSDIIATKDILLGHNVIQDKILQSRVTLLLDEISQTLALFPSGDARLKTNDDLFDTLLAQTEKLRNLSAEMSNYLARLRTTRQHDLTKTLNQLIFSTACALIALMIGAAMFLRNHLHSEKRAQDGQRAALQSETILSTTLDADVVADERGLIRKYNASAERIFGYSADEALGQDISDLIIPEQYRRAHKAGMNRFLTSNSKRVIGSGRVKLDARDKQGRQFPVELSLEVMEQNGENLFISFLRDISEEVAAEAELVKARDKALKSEQAKADFLAIMSHEMRTPLNGLTGAIELLETTDLTTSQSKYLNTLRQSASELQHHVNEVLDIAHLEAGRVASVEETFDLRRLIHQVVDEHSELALVNENQLSIDWDENLETVVSTDPHKVGQILSNLVNNALKFTKRGQITVQVDRHISPHEEFMVELRITDTGIGIPDKFLKHIFDDFTTLDNSYTRTSNGVGLGLGIVRRMVAALNGSMGVNSHEGAGSTFWVRIPVQKVPQDIVIEHAEQQELPMFQTLKILMVEDNDINRFVLREMLINEGHQVVEAENGKIAIDTLEQGNFDVILMDISMPIMDGVAATKYIREHAKQQDIPIVACTAHTQPEEIERFRQAGMTDFVQKPIERSKLLPALYQSVLASDIEQNRSVEMTDEILNMRVLGEISEQLGHDTAEMLLSRYEDEANALMTLLNSQQGKDAPVEDLIRDIHKTAGSSAQLGLSAMRHKLNVIEVNVKQQGVDALWSEIDNLNTLWKNSRDAIRNEGFLS